MRLDEITVEVRDRNLVRVGAVPTNLLVLTIKDAFNNVGTWTLSLPADHYLADALALPGAGLIVTGPGDVIISGPMTKVETAVTPQDPAGIVNFEGVSDTVRLLDALAWPQPANGDVTTQTVGHDDRTGAAETLLHQYVDANIGPSAVADRQVPGLVMGVDFGRGPQVTKHARFPVLGALLAEIAVLGGLGFRVVQRGAQLVFETYVVTDRSREIRLDVRNRQLSAQRVAVTPPSVTDTYIGGQGEMEDRTFVHVDNTVSRAAASEWNRRIEVFIDQRQTDDQTQLVQAGNEKLADGGFTNVVVQAVPMEDSSMPFGTAWNIGDNVGVVVDDQELTSIVTGMVLKADDQGFFVGALLGDSTNFDKDAAMTKRLNALEKQVSLLLSR